MSPSPALGGLLGAVLALGLALVWKGVPIRRRPSLQDRIEPYLGDPMLQRAASMRRRPGPSLHAADPASALRDLVGPTLDGAAERLSRLLGGTPSVRRRLAQSGSSLTVHAFRLEQVVWGVAGLAAALVVSVLLLAGGSARSPVLLLVFCAAAGVAGIMLRDQRLSAAVRDRERAMLAEFPTIADLLALAVAAGEAPVAALDRVARNSSGALPSEIRRALQDARTGDGLVRALDRVAERTSLAPLARFVDGVAVALDRGTPLAEVLRSQAADVREAHKRIVLEAGGRKEIAMMLPVVFLVLPITVVFALYPGIVQISAVVP